jgi:hypothetical protein
VLYAGGGTSNIELLGNGAGGKSLCGVVSICTQFLKSSCEALVMGGWRLWLWCDTRTEPPSLSMCICSSGTVSGAGGRGGTWDRPMLGVGGRDRIGREGDVRAANEASLRN